MTTTDRVLTIGCWVGAVAVGLNLAVSGFVFGRGRHVYTWVRRLHPRRWALYNTLWSIFALAYLIPAVVHGPTFLRKVAAVVGLASLIGATLTLFWARQAPAGTQQGSTATEEPKRDSRQPQQTV